MAWWNLKAHYVSRSGEPVPITHDLLPEPQRPQEAIPLSGQRDRPRASEEVFASSKCLRRHVAYLEKGKKIKK